MDHYQKIKHVPWSIKDISILEVLLAFQPLYFEPPIEPSMIKAYLKANFILVFLFLLVFSSSAGHAQQYGGFPLIEKDSLLLDFELLKQGLEKYHTGLYWYTSKDRFDGAFARAKSKINRDMNVLEFHKVIAPLISMSKEAHTALVLPQSINNGIREKATYSGGSEFASMAYSQNIGAFVGQETGGGYYGNTSGYREEFVLPHSKIQVEIPALQFKLNVEEKIPFGRGVIPHYGNPNH